MLRFPSVMRWVLGVSVCGIFGVLAYTRLHDAPGMLSPLGQSTTVVWDRPLDRYSIDYLSLRQGISGPLVLEAAVATDSAYTVYTFSYKSDGKRVSGLAHIPAHALAGTKAPVIVQFRGYVEQSKYAPGMGTKHSAEVFAKNGYISLAPDFLGYGSSDVPSADVFEERFQTYTAALDLLASLGSLPMADASSVGIWAHSNGGQIALTVLAVTGGTNPCVLWAPVTKPFPYSILYYSVDAPDRGKALRKKLAGFEALYDADRYSFVNYTDRIRSPILLQQGTGDDAVPVTWSDDFYGLLKGQGKSVRYYTYPGADHDMRPVWDTVISRDLEFFRSRLAD